VKERTDREENPANAQHRCFFEKGERRRRENESMPIQMERELASNKKCTPFILGRGEGGEHRKSPMEREREGRYSLHLNPRRRSKQHLLPSSPIIE